MSSELISKLSNLKFSYQRTHRLNYTIHVLMRGYKIWSPQLTDEQRAVLKNIFGSSELISKLSNLKFSYQRTHRLNYTIHVLMRGYKTWSPQLTDEQRAVLKNIFGQKRRSHRMTNTTAWSGTNGKIHLPRRRRGGAEV